MSTADLWGRVGFAVGTGRCGTHFVSRLLAAEPGIASCHERGRMNEAFRRYCAWNGLPIDHEGFLAAKAREIRRDLGGHAFSFEASAYLSLSVSELFQRFRARFVLLVRRPHEVVNSYWSKGWYAAPFVQGDPARALGYQDDPGGYYFFARLAPRGREFVAWNAMTRVGKIAWYWNALNLAVLDQFADLPPDHHSTVRVEHLSHTTYLELARFLGIQPTIGPQEYQRIVRQRPGRRLRLHSLAAWSPRERAEFEEQVSPAAERLGHEYHVDRLLDTVGRGEALPSHATMGDRLRRVWVRVERGVRARVTEDGRHAH